MAIQIGINSYVTTEEADAYFEDRLDSTAWDISEELRKSQALITATSVVDDNAWIGYSKEDDQILGWPRSGATYFNNVLGRQKSFKDTEIPTNIKYAVFEQALHLLNNEDVMQGSSLSYESISVGPISLSDNDSKSKIQVKSKVISKLLSGLIKRKSAGPLWRAW